MRLLYEMRAGYFIIFPARENEMSQNSNKFLVYKIRLFLLMTTAVISACHHSDSDEIPHAAWTPWTVSDTAVFSGQFPLVGDPSVIHEGSSYRMYYTGFDPYRDPQGPEICEAISSDGIHWTNLNAKDSVQGRVLFTNSNGWSNAHETCFLLHSNNDYKLYFTRYEDTGSGFFGATEISLGLATSSDGLHFTQVADTAILKSSPHFYDRSALSSPSITKYRDSLFMMYTGFRYDTTIVTQLLYTTSKDGVHWKKGLKPAIKSNEAPWAENGVAGSEIILGPDNFYYLFMTSVKEPHIIGVARSLTPKGPWDINPVPIVKADKLFSSKGAVAPCVLIEDGKVRLWYHGFADSTIRIGYAEATWPLKK
jgi:predicted GH43/DUF377 family glycosyl hydrolase